MRWSLRSTAARTRGGVLRSERRRRVRGAARPGSRRRASIEHLLKEGVLERLGSTVTPQPVLAVAPMPSPSIDVLASDGLVLVGVALADPGNVGTLLRSAEASGAAAIVLQRRIGRCLQSQSRSRLRRRDLRSSRPRGVVGGGGARRVGAAGPAAVGRRRPHRHARTTTSTSRSPPRSCSGNEAHGLPSDLDAHLDGRVTVPMHGPAESLNVAMAGVVLCFESARQRAHGSAR